MADSRILPMDGGVLAFDELPQVMALAQNTIELHQIVLDRLNEEAVDSTDPTAGPGFAPPLYSTVPELLSGLPLANRTKVRGRIRSFLQDCCRGDCLWLEENACSWGGPQSILLHHIDTTKKAGRLPPLCSDGLWRVLTELVTEYVFGGSPHGPASMCQAIRLKLSLAHGKNMLAHAAPLGDGTPSGGGCRHEDPARSDSRGGARSARQGSALMGAAPLGARRSGNSVHGGTASCSSYSTHRYGRAVPAGARGGGAGSGTSSRSGGTSGGSYGDTGPSGATEPPPGVGPQSDSTEFGSHQLGDAAEPRGEDSGSGGTGDVRYTHTPVANEPPHPAADGSVSKGQCISSPHCAHSDQGHAPPPQIPRDTAPDASAHMIGVRIEDGGAAQ